MKLEKKIKSVQESSKATQEQKDIILRHVGGIHSVELRLCLGIKATRKDREKIVQRFMQESGLHPMTCAIRTADFVLKQNPTLKNRSYKNDCFLYVMSNLKKQPEMLNDLVTALTKKENGKS